MADVKTTKDVQILQKALYACGTEDEVKILKIIKQLSKLPVSIAILQSTGVGKQVNKYRKWGGRVTDYARTLVHRWKEMLLTETQSNEEGNYEGNQCDSRSHVEDSEDQRLVHHQSYPGKEKKRDDKTRVKDERRKSSKSTELCHSEKSKTEKTAMKRHVETERFTNDSAGTSDHRHEKSNSVQLKKSSKTEPVKKKAKVKVRDEEVSYESTGMSFLECLNLDTPKKGKKLLKQDKVKTTVVSSSNAATDSEFHSNQQGAKHDQHSGKRKDKKKHKHKRKERFAGSRDDAGTHKVRETSGRSGSVMEKNSTDCSGSKTSREMKRKLEIPTVDESRAKKAKESVTSPLDINMPAINPDYKPLRLPQLDTPKRRTAGLDEAALTAMSTSKQSRTKVFSGRARNIIYDHVPSLYDMCMRVLCDNIDALEDVGGIPYDILSPVLEKCTVDQLFTLEDYNPHFLEDTDQLWKRHCERDFRREEPDEFETWRELYLRKLDERKVKLEKITANIAASMAQKKPERQLKLAFMSGPAKPPREVFRKQAKLGTAGPVSQHKTPQRSSSQRSHSTVSHTSSSSSGSIHGGDAIAASRPPKPVKIVAPMMMKSLKMMKRLKR
ncbi:elongin-A-like [Ptychodera flava]|uniref:elongin-A-like n=1 Tax=Ptychodera flava TaxID=63121 RepID=UPI00396A7976